MGDKRYPGRSLRAAATMLTLLWAPPLLVGCATNSYTEASSVVGAGDPELQEFAKGGRPDDRPAMYALAGRLERGDGVPQDLTRAKLLYAKVAVARGGRWLPPTARGSRNAPIHAGAVEDDLARAARARLEALAGSPELRLRWIVVKGIFDPLDDNDDAGNETAAQACRALTGEFAPLIEPKPLPGCGFKGFSRHGSDRVYAAVTYNESKEGVSTSSDSDDAMTVSRLSIWPIPNPGDCGVYNAVELLRGREIVATILVSEHLPRDKRCHSRVRVSPPGTSIRE